MSARRLTSAIVLACALPCAALVAACGGSPPVVAQARRIAHDATAGDTSGDAAPPTAEDARVVGKLVQDYLRVRPARIAPNPYWRRDEQRRFRNFDVAGAWTYGSRAFRERYGPYHVEVESAPAFAEPGTLEATVHFTPRTPGAASPVSVRLFARREHGQWRLGSALMQLTRRWPETHVGRITFRTQAGLVLDSTRAADAARYVDSLAAAFDVAPPRDLLYVLTRSPTEAMLALGITDPVPKFGGMHNGRNRLIISGGGWRDRHAYHELAHAVFNEVADYGRVHALVMEGSAEWMEWRTALRNPHNAHDEAGGRGTVAAVLARRPRLSLGEVVRLADADARAVMYPAGAWLVGRVYAAAGVRGVRDLLVTPAKPDEVLSTARRHLHMSQAQVDSAWRAWAHGTVSIAPTP
jgi:hypothetical protein